MVPLKEIMAQLQIFTTSDYFKKYLFDNNKKQNLKNFLKSFQKSEISRRLLIGENDSLGFLILVDMCTEHKKSHYPAMHTQIIDIFPDFRNFMSAGQNEVY